MDAATMTKKVADETRLEREVAEQAIAATLRILAERINGDEARELASQVPVEFQGAVEEAAAASQEGEPFDRDEFLGRVGRQVDLDDGDLPRVVRVVFDVVGSSVSPGEWGDVLSQLPNDLEPLFSGEGPAAHSG